MQRKESIHYWRRLDNSAKIFPISAGKKYSTVFRFSAVMKEKIEPSVLRLAVNKALSRYGFFRVRLKDGIFWNYLEYNPKKIVIEKEKEYPCKYIDPIGNNGYLFKVTYFDKKISIDIFHALTDGNTGSMFFREIVYNYIELTHKEEFKEELRTTRKIDLSTEDSYIKNYNKKAKGNNSNKKAYKLAGKKIKLGAISAIHEIINLDELKKETKKEGATITQYLTAVLIYSIYKANYIKNKGKKPIKVCIPINLKKYFVSNTMANFFSYMTIEAKMKEEQLNSFDKILEFVKQDFSKKLTPNEIEKTMSGNVKLGINPFIKVIPLILKKPLVRLSYIEIRKYTTTTFSNIGRIGIIGKYQKYIENFFMLIAPEPVEKIKCSACSYENNIVFTFTSILDDSSIEREFYNFLQNKNINVKIESNGVLDVISEKIN
ncbi:MAG: hypothetical protein ACLS90_09090 [Clostridia bacterium]